MFVLLQLVVDPSDHDRRYVSDWAFVDRRPLDGSLGVEQFLIYTKDLPKDFFKDSHRYYVDSEKKIRKNPHRKVR